MSEEMLELVNENDEVIGTCTRKDAHEKGLLHRGSVVLVFNREGKILIQKRSQKKDIAGGLLALSAAGHVISGHSYRETAERELYEELGIKARLYEMGKIRKSVVFSENKIENEILTVYMCEHEGPFMVQKNEIDMVTFAGIDEISWMIYNEPENYTHNLKAVIGIFFADIILSDSIKLISHTMIDYVNKNNESIGQITRDEAHAKGLYHRSVCILVFNSKGDILMQKRSITKDICPGLWDASVGGHVDYGESYEDAAMRELSEELGIECDLEKLGIFFHHSEYADGLTDNEFYGLFRCVYDGPVIISEETDEIKSFPVDDVMKMVQNGKGVTIGFIQAFREYMKIISR